MTVKVTRAKRYELDRATMVVAEDGQITLTIDRTGWPAGEWDDEPDRVEWRWYGFPCLIVRHPNGHWCGYVGVPKGHPYHKCDPWDLDVLVHGSLNYGGFCSPPVCHVSKYGESEPWWLGFDCAHCNDLAPAWLSNWQIYRTQEYVMNEVKSLARKLSGVARRAR